MRTRVLASALTAAICVAPAPRACTTFCFETAGGLVFGKNYDWNVGAGLLLVNKRGVAKRAFTDENPARWTSRYGSVTFNQYGCEFPCGGINEKGLVVELMWLDAAEYPRPDARSALPTLQWIQYQLDCSATVDDVVASDRVVRIEGRSAMIHFLVADARGNTAAVEYLGGKMVVHRGADLPYRTLTNDTYQRSAAYAGRVGDMPREGSRSSLDRFAVAAMATSAGIGVDENPIDAAFELLARVSQGEFTQWSIVYDIAATRVYFRTRTAPAPRWLDLGALDFSCASAVQIVDLNERWEGDVSSRLDAYTVEANRRLVDTAYGATEFLRGVPAERRLEVARFPENQRCAP